MKMKERREAAGISRVEMAKRIGMPLRTLEDWEYGLAVPGDPRRLLKMAEILGCTIEELITG